MHPISAHLAQLEFARSTQLILTTFTKICVSQFSADHLGWRGDELLLQGEIQGHPEAVVLEEPLSFSEREAPTSGADRVDHHSSQQLVQEQEVETATHTLRDH